MARFLLIHSAVTDATQEQIIGAAKKVMASLAPGAQWLNSWVAPGVWKLFCEWEAPDANAVIASLESAKDLLPIESIHEVERIDPEWYK